MTTPATNITSPVTGLPETVPPPIHPTWSVSMPAPNAGGCPVLTISAPTAAEACAAYVQKLKLSNGANPTAKPTT